MHLDVISRCLSTFSLADDDAYAVFRDDRENMATGRPILEAVMSQISMAQCSLLFGLLRIYILSSGGGVRSIERSGTALSASAVRGSCPTKQAYRNI